MPHSEGGGGRVASRGEGCFSGADTVDLNGKRRTAMVYIMNTTGQRGEYRPLNQPWVGYYTTILEGYKAAGFDEDILRQATKDSVETDGDVKL